MQKKMRTMPAHFKLTAREFYEEYSENEVAADQKYRGKIVILTGTIRDIGKDLWDNAYVALYASSNQFDSSGVRCYFFESEEPKIAKLTKG